MVCQRPGLCNREFESNVQDLERTALQLGAAVQCVRCDTKISSSFSGEYQYESEDSTRGLNDLSFRTHSTHSPVLWILLAVTKQIGTTRTKIEIFDAICVFGNLAQCFVGHTTPPGPSILGSNKVFLQGPSETQVKSAFLFRLARRSFNGEGILKQDQ